MSQTSAENLSTETVSAEDVELAEKYKNEANDYFKSMYFQM